MKRNNTYYTISALYLKINDLKNSEKYEDKVIISTHELERGRANYYTMYKAYLLSLLGKDVSAEVMINTIDYTRDEFDQFIKPFFVPFIDINFWNSMKNIINLKKEMDKKYAETFLFIN